MKTKQRLIVIAFSIVVLPLFGQSTVSDTSTLSETWFLSGGEKDIFYQPDTSSFPGRIVRKFYYQADSSVYEKGVSANAEEMIRLDSLMRAGLSDGSIRIRSILLTGYASIDNMYYRNDLLAKHRAEGMRDVLLNMYPELKNYPITITWVAEDWEKLSKLIASSSMPDRNAILEIIQENDIFKGREAKLMDFKRGVPYRQMASSFFPLLRRVEVSFEFDPITIIKEEENRVNMDSAKDSIHLRTDSLGHGKGLASDSRFTSDKEASPVFVLKTNLLYDATATFNLGAEIKLSSSWTIDVPVSYNPWTYENNRKWKHVLVQPELRYWSGSAFSGHFLGIHGHYAAYNIGGIPWISTFKNYRYEGWLSGAGVSYGYHKALSNHWAFEATLGVGYVYVTYDKYKCRGCGEKLDSGKKNYLGPTKAGISLIYKFE